MRERVTCVAGGGSGIGRAAVEAFAAIAENCGRLDALVNRAGVDRTPGERFEKLMKTGSLLRGMEDRGG